MLTDLPVWIRQRYYHRIGFASMQNWLALSFNFVPFNKIVQFALDVDTVIVVIFDPDPSDSVRVISVTATAWRNNGVRDFSTRLFPFVPRFYPLIVSETCRRSDSPLLFPM